MKLLKTLLEELRENIPNHSKTAPAVSASSVGWHIEHALLVLDVTVKALQKSDPAAYKWSFNIWRTVLFFLGRFPRGKGKAPKVVQPSEAFDETSLRLHLQETKERVETISMLHSRHFLNHPYFGMLNRKDAVWFMELHTRHHLNIIRDILHNTW